MSYAARLKKLSNRWKKTKPQGGGGNVPDGKYQAEITKALLQEGKSGNREGHLCVVLKLKIVNGEYTGRYARDVDFDLEWVSDKTPAGQKEPYSGMGFFMGLLKDKLEIDPPKALTEQAITKILKTIKGMVVDIQIKSKDGYSNTYINRLVNAQADDVDEDDLEEEEDLDENEEELEEDFDEDEDEEESEDEEEDEEEDEDDLDLDEDDEEEEDEEEEEEEPAPKKKTSRKKTAKKSSGKKKTTKKAASKKTTKKTTKKSKPAEDEDDWDEEWED